MIGFTSTPTLGVLPDGKTWKLVNDLEYETGYGAIKIPAGFETDFASIPRFFRVIASPATGKHRMAAILHDSLYTDRIFSRGLCDWYFRDAMIRDGVPRWLAWIMWAAVRVGGGGHFKPLFPG